MNNAAIKAGQIYAATRRDLIHGSLTFVVRTNGEPYMGGVSVTQIAVEYPDGTVEESDMRLSIPASAFGDRYLPRA